MNRMPFVGRMEEMELLATLLRPESTARLVTLIGAPGVGKTRLAQQAAHVVAEHFRDGVVCVDLGYVEGAEAVVPAIVSALHLSIPPDVAPEAVLLAFAAASHMLLVLDTCEHLIGEVVRVVELLLERTPLPAICCTSREPLGCAREVCVTVAPLPVPQLGSLHLAGGVDENGEGGERPGADDLLLVDSVRVFCGVAEQARPGILFEGGDWALIGAICRYVDGVPLALALAADQLRYFSLAEVASRLRERLLMLSSYRLEPRASGQRTSVRHRSLMTAVEWSWQLLCEDERRLLWRLSIFAGGFTLDAVEAFCTGKGIAVARVLDLLTRLLDKSMVIAERTEHGSRFRLLEIVRAYARVQLDASGEGEELALGHATYFAAIAMRSHDGFLGSDSGRWVCRVDDEYANLCAAQACLVQVSLADAARMAADLAFYFVWRGRLQDAFAWAAALQRANADRREPEVEWSALRLRGMASLWARDFVAGYKAILDAYRAAQAARLTMQVARTRLLLAGAALYSGYTSHAEMLVGELSGGGGLGAWEAAVVYMLRSLLCLVRGELVQSRELASESVRRMRAIGEMYGLCAVLQHLAVVLLRSGHGADAAPLLQESLERARAAGGRWCEIQSLRLLVQVAVARGDVAQAVKCFAELVGLLQETGQEVSGSDLRRLATIAAQVKHWGLVVQLHAAVEQRALVRRPLLGGWGQQGELELDQARAALGSATLTLAYQAGRSLPPRALVRRVLDDLANVTVPVQAGAQELLELALLGPIQVRVGRRVIHASDWKYQASRDLLIYLVCRGRARRDELGEVFWPDSTPAKQRNSLNVCMFYLRKALGDTGWIRREGESYLLDPARLVSFDLREFDRLLVIANAETLGLQERLGHLRQALVLVRGAVLSDVTDCDWFLEFRSKVEQRVQSARLQAGWLSLQLGLSQDALSEFERALQADPLSEEACQGCMRAHARMGNLAAVVLTYQRLYTLLSEELAIAPSTASRELYRELVHELGGYEP